MPSLVAEIVAGNGGGEEEREKTITAIGLPMSFCSEFLSTRSMK
jgi:hypothetical protein